MQCSKDAAASSGAMIGLSFDDVKLAVKKERRLERPDALSRPNIMAVAVMPRCSSVCVLVKFVVLLADSDDKSGTIRVFEENELAHGNESSIGQSRCHGPRVLKLKNGVAYLT